MIGRLNGTLREEKNVLVEDEGKSEHPKKKVVSRFRARIETSQIKNGIERLIEWSSLPILYLPRDSLQQSISYLMD